MTPAPDTVAVTMPQLGETVAEGTVLRWLKQVGDTVQDQEPLLEIATDKVDTEVPSPGAGVLVEIVVGEDTTVAVGTVLAHLGPEREPAASLPAASQPVASQPAASRAASGPRHRHSPRVRRLAREAGLDPDTLDGTGPSGRVTPEDVARAAQAGESVPSADPSPTAAPSAAATGPAGGASQTAPPGRARSDADVAGRVRSLRTVTASVDVTAVLRNATGVGGGTSTDEGFAAVVTSQAVAALRSCPVLLGAGADPGHVAVLVRRSSADGDRGTVVDHAEELNPEGILRRLLEVSAASASSPSTAHATLGFSGDDHVLTDVEDPGPAQFVGIGFSRPSPRVVVVDQDGGSGIAIRPTAYVSVRFDQGRVDAPVVRTFLRDLVARLASA